MGNVPIVTEVTKAQLDALVADNGLNEGLQYKVIDLGWLLTATSTNTYIHFGNIPYKSFVGLISQVGTDPPTVTILHNTIGNIVWSYDSPGRYFGTLLGAFTPNKVYMISGNRSINIGGFCVFTPWDSDSIRILTIDALGGNGVDNALENEAIEIRIYF